MDAIYSGGDKEKEVTKNMAPEKALTMRHIAGRIYNNREDNIYSEKIIYEILKMCMDECKKGLLKGERIQLSGIGTIIPEVKTHEHNYVVCGKEYDNLPYTSMKMSRNHSLVHEMNQTLQRNIENGILGLEELPFSKQQIAILKKGGFVPDKENESEEE